MEAKLGVVWTIKNRCSMAPAQGFQLSTTDNILHPGAFSSFNQGDPNSVKYPNPGDPGWRDSLAAAQSDSADPTVGRVFYYSAPLSAPPRAWGKVEHGADIGGLHFYRIAA